LTAGIICGRNVRVQIISTETKFGLNMTETESEPLQMFDQPGGAAEEEIHTVYPEVGLAGYDLRILHSLRRIIRAVDLHSRKLSMQHHITGPQLACLMTISNQGPMTASSLAKEVCLSPSTLVGILDRLEQKELVARTRSHLDRRTVSIETSAKGRDLVSSAPPSLQKKLAAVLQELPDSEQVSIALSLEKIALLLEADSLKTTTLVETDPLLHGEFAEKKKT